jgi:hypothetical protein
MQGFTIPDAAQHATDLTLAHQQGTSKLAPNSRVLCINRGKSPLKDTFNGFHLDVPPGYFETEYGAALHFQRRLIVPGTRNLEVGGYVSWIGILGSTDGKIRVDREEDCEPFSDEELLKFGERIEAIDRGPDSGLVVKKVSGVRASMMSGRRTGVQVDASTQATDEAAANAEVIFEPPTESATREDSAEAPSLASVARTVRRR